LCIERSLDPSRQIFGPAGTPEMQEDDARLLVDHVLVDGNDGDVRLA
jgi:hypothetical protein